MDTNKSKFTKVDLTEIRKEGKDTRTKQERIDNRSLRNKHARRTRRVEKQIFNQLLDDEDYDETLDFYKR